MKTVNMPQVHIKLIASCIRCEKDIPFKQSMHGKMLCSKKCLKEVNKAIKYPKFYYDIDDVVKKSES